MADVEIFYTPQELKKILRIEYNTVLRRLNSGIWKGVKIGNRWRIREEEVNKIKDGYYNDKEDFQKVDMFYTPDELAEILKVSSMTVWRKLNDGTIRGIRVGTKWRITENEVNKIKEGLNDEEKQETE